jgi:hypothetical protein
MQVTLTWLIFDFQISIFLSLISDNFSCVWASPPPLQVLLIYLKSLQQRMRRGGVDFLCAGVINGVNLVALYLYVTVIWGDVWQKYYRRLSIESVRYGVFGSTLRRSPVKFVVMRKISFGRGLTTHLSSSAPPPPSKASASAFSAPPTKTLASTRELLI